METSFACRWAPPAGHSMTAGGLSCEGCAKLERQEVMARWVLNRLRPDGVGEVAWSTWTLRPVSFSRFSDSVHPLAYTRIGVAAIRSKAEWLATQLTGGAESGSAFVAVEGWTTGEGRLNGDQPRHHLHSLSTVRRVRLSAVSETWQKRNGHVMTRHVQGGDLKGLALYVVKDCVKANGYFAVGGDAWRRST